MNTKSVQVVQMYEIKNYHFGALSHFNVKMNYILKIYPDSFKNILRPVIKKTFYFRLLEKFNLSLNNQLIYFNFTKNENIFVVNSS